MSAKSQANPPSVTFFVTGIILAGMVSAGLSLWHWNSPDPQKFFGVLAAALLSAGMRMSVPGVSSTLSISFLFVLYGLLELTGPEIVVMAIATSLVQSYSANDDRPALSQVLFQATTSAFAAGLASWIYSSELLGTVDGEKPFRFAAAMVLLFIGNTLPIGMAISILEETPLWSTWRESFFWSVPYYLGGGALAQVASFLSRNVGWQAVILAGPALYLVFRAYRLHVHRLQAERFHAEQMSSLHLRTIEALALAIEAKDDTTHDHLARVQVYAREMARELGLSAADQEALRAASILHDIGKLAVPEHIISKPGRLTPEEFEKMKIHPLVGAEILERVQFPYPVVPIVRAHHEKWDGSGYPYGLVGEDIPIGARILSAVDMLDALATDRQYRKALPLDEAMKIVQKEAGRSLDPRVVELLGKRYVELERMAKSQPQPEALKLSLDAKITLGEAPAAGFESAGPLVPETTTSRGDFLMQIAAARQEVHTMFEISQGLGSSLSLNETLSMLCARLNQLVPHHSITVWVKGDEMLRPEYVSGDDAKLFASLEIPVGQGLSGWVADNRKPIVNGNPSVEPGYTNDAKRFSTLRSAISVPLEGVSGVVGVLSLYHQERDSFTKDHLRILLAISSKLAFSIENALRYSHAESSATTDFLTQLPNARSLFLHLDAELVRTQETNSTLSVLVLDLDEFKQINDRDGHLAGNRVLKTMASSLKSVCREYDYVARMGGDEFVVLLPGIRPADVEARIMQFRSVISERFFDQGTPLGVSIGVAHFPQDADNAEGLLTHADRSMYKEKGEHRNKPRSSASRGAFSESLRGAADAVSQDWALLLPGTRR
jgi:diguanylate cyclase (GGDEF)-like protein/putative nucleotidyltransferase with HDIG domain